MNIKDYKGNTPLHLCCFTGHLDPANVLILVPRNVLSNNYLSFVYFFCVFVCFVLFLCSSCLFDRFFSSHLF